MLYRKIETVISNHLQSDSDKVMLIDGARQIGKTYIIRHVGKKLFKNYIEINMAEDFQAEKSFLNVSSVNDFYFKLSMLYGEKMGKKSDTLIFIDEIQTYPQLLTLLKFLRTDGKYTYIASGSLLGVTLNTTSSIPMGSIEPIKMYPLDFEEFLYANGFNAEAVTALQAHFAREESLDETTHETLMNLFKRYLIVGGLPDAVNAFIETRNVAKIRKVQEDTRYFYAADASKYGENQKLTIRRIYDMIPSNLENKKKRVVFKDIEGKKGCTFERYQDEFEYLTNAGIALEVKAVSSPKFPLTESSAKNLLKLYLNDVGILTNVLYKLNPNAILDDVKSIKLGTIYENAVACELKAHGFDLYYYDNRKKGEVDFIIDDYDALATLPIEVKSGKDYTVHHAINTFLANKDYNVKKGLTFSNEREVTRGENGIIYMPVYYAMFLKPNREDNVTI